MRGNPREAGRRCGVTGSGLAFPGVSAAAILAMLIPGGATSLAGDEPPFPGSGSPALERPQAPNPFPQDGKDSEPAWPGSFRLFGTETRLAAGGFAQLDAIRDSGAIGSPCWFITATIPTDVGTPSVGADGQTSYCVKASRLTFESRTPTSLGRLKTFVSLDLFGEPFSTEPSLRLRQVYGELSGALFGGDLLMGQAWGTYVALEAWPDILDFEGPNSAIAVRQPMVRWTRGVSSGVDVRLAFEQAGGGSVEGTDLLTRWPDSVGVVNWASGGGFLRASTLLRDIRVRANDGPVVGAVGWGVAGSGKLPIPGLGVDDNLVVEVSYGEGTGGYYNDGPASGAWDPVNSRLELLPLFAFYAAFEHGWSRSVSSTVLYAYLEVDSLGFEPDNAFKKSGYFSLNLIWRPDPALMFGVELLSGGRRDKSGAEGTVNRLQLTGQFGF